MRPGFFIVRILKTCYFSSEIQEFYFDKYKSKEKILLL